MNSCIPAIGIYFLYFVKSSLYFGERKDWGYRALGVKSKTKRTKNVIPEGISGYCENETHAWNTKKKNRETNLIFISAYLGQEANLNNIRIMITYKTIYIDGRSFGISCKPLPIFFAYHNWFEETRSFLNEFFNPWQIKKPLTLQWARLKRW